MVLCSRNTGSIIVRYFEGRLRWRAWSHCGAAVVRLIVGVVAITFTMRFWVHKRVSDRFFFAFVYVLLFVVGLKLVYDGLGGFV